MVNVVLKQTSSGTVIQEMNDSADKDYLAHVLLTDFNSSDSGVGTLAINPSGRADSSDLVLIGTFTDTNRTTAPGGEPSDSSFNSSFFNFYQNLGTASESISNATRPLALDSSGDNIQRMNDTKVNVDFISDTQQKLVNSGVGMYKLQPTAPTDGTWVQKATITDSLQNTSNTTKLWRKSAPASTPATVRPLKYVAASSSLREMTDTEIKQYTARLRNQIKDGVGQYKLQTSAPTSGGTWVVAGVALNDTRYQILTSQFTSAQFSNTFQGFFTGNFTGFFTRNYTLFFNGNVGGFFTGTIAKNFSNNFSNFFTGFFTSNFTGIRVQNATETVNTVRLWVRIA